MDDVDWLSLSDAAVMLGVSRPYASMLANHAQLGEVRTVSGRRCVQAAALDAWRASHAKQYGDALSPRQAGIEAGLYEVPGLEALSTVELVVQHELPEVGFVYADDVGGNRFFIDADTRVRRPLTAGQVLDAEVTDEGYVVAAYSKQDLASHHVKPADGNVFEDLGLPPEEARALLEDAERRIAQEKAPSGEGAE